MFINDLMKKGKEGHLLSLFCLHSLLFVIENKSLPHKM
jgi:hypothetical protein